MGAARREQETWGGSTAWHEAGQTNGRQGRTSSRVLVSETATTGARARLAANSAAGSSSKGKSSAARPLGDSDQGRA
jgi:hypothetical protein